MRLPWEMKEQFRDWLLRHYRLKAQHVMSRVHQMRGGRDNDPGFGSRMTGEGELAKLLEQRFHKACARLGFGAERMLRNSRQDTTLFRPPSTSGQMDLF